MIAALCIPLGAAAEPDVLNALRERARRLDRLRASFTLAEFQAPQDRDPFDTSNWLWPPHACVHQYTFVLLRPHFLIHHEAGRDPQQTMNWLDGVHVGLQLEPDGSWSGTRNRVRRLAATPYPWLTFFDMDVLDLERSLVELIEHGWLAVRGVDPMISLAGEVPTSPTGPRWNLRVTLDPAHDYALVDITCDIRAGGGVIEWRLRVNAYQPVGASWLPKTAVAAVKNTNVNKTHWQMYEFRLLTAAIDPRMTQRDLAITIPTTNAKFIDQIEGWYRAVDANGRVAEERRWDPAEYEANMQAIARANYLRQQSAAELRRRRTVFFAIIATAVVAAASLGGWAWLRQRRLTA